MAFRYQSQQPTICRVLPPKWKILEPEGSIAKTPRRYLERMDDSETSAQIDDATHVATGDLVSHVFGNQLETHGTNSYALAKLIIDRQQLTNKHLDDIRWRIDELMPRKPIRPSDEGGMSEIEKQIIDLEHQKRQVQLNEWRDLLDVRKAIAEERQAYRAVRTRMNYLTGGYGGVQ